MVITPVIVVLVMAMAMILFAAAPLAGEHHEHLPRHVKGRQERRKRRQSPGRLAPAKRFEQYFILREKASEWRHTGKRQHANQITPKRDWHVLLQATHLPHVLLVVRADDDAPRTEEQQRLEKRVGEQMKLSRHQAARTEPHHHEPKL